MPKSTKRNLRVSPATWARTAVLILALVNQFLSAAGKSPLPIDSEQVEQLVSAGITTVAALVAWWKNNSFTCAALNADEFYRAIRRGEYD